jgi:hypothetical protein
MLVLDIQIIGEGSIHQQLRQIRGRAATHGWGVMVARDRTTDCMCRRSPGLARVCRTHAKADDAVHMHQERPIQIHRRGRHRMLAPSGAGEPPHPVSSGKLARWGKDIDRPLPRLLVAEAPQRGAPDPGRVAPPA